jgi:hypothetical protein
MPPRPPQVSPYPTTPALPATPRIGVLMPTYRFGWLGLPLLTFIGVAGFTLPAETAYAVLLGFVPALVISRIVLAREWLDSHGGGGFVDRVIGWISKDIGGAVGLLVLAACMVAVTAYVVLPIVAFTGPGQHPSLIRLGRAIFTERPVGVFSSTQATGYFVHLIVTIPVLVVAARVLLRTRAAWDRPLLLPRLAAMINNRPVSLKVAVAGALLGLAVVLIGLNSGLAPSKLPMGAICTIGHWTCAHHANVVRSTARQVYLLANR